MTSWKLTLPCTRAEAEAIEIGDALAAIEPVPVLMTSERVVDDPNAWQLDAYFEAKPGKAAIASLRALVPSAGDAEPVVEKLAEEDWVTLSQAGIEPVATRRFYVHTGTNKGEVPMGAKAFRIEAGLAFGTGTHETTSGCLMMLEAIRAQGAVVRNLIDLGTGTGLLAFAAMHLWPRAYATATDIDPVAIDVTVENAGVNGVPLGLHPGELALTVADGAADPLVLARAPYDLVIANILAGPLIAMSADFAALTAPGGQIVLAGLLTSQADAVARAYRRHGCRMAGRIERGDWTILRLRKRRR
ncbi:50S ribosomal protein L11 methyltransferase [Sphingomonas cannabina]|uniref:50S ribosomal protein L11 methyltransferase n=1 Tax=Sphingomonas cannabina TaxID=2899123 RepID=UPI001F2F369C|nr:50S ribosomal protein L11 methyltransferase [Sphingomonas cannabina]UIJ45282.1 50S ribosomal protein L11 methyltransferase [Sphingomonas cannabina]